MPRAGTPTPRTAVDSATMGARQGAAFGALVGALYGIATAVALAWHFRADILAPSSVGHVQLFDPASKLLGLVRWIPGDFLQQFYAPGLVAKAPLVLELLVANLVVGAVLGLGLGTLLRWWPPTAFPRRGVLFASAFLVVSGLLHALALTPMILDPQRPRSLRAIISESVRRMLSDGPAANLALLGGALVAGFWLWPRLQRTRAVRVPLAGTALALVALSLGDTVPTRRPFITAEGAPVHTAIAARPRNVVLISIDSLRADHLGCYGYRRSTSPALDRMAAQGVRFASAYAPSSWTLPSHATMFTGRYPLSHGVVLPDRRLSPALPTLATVLQRAGYTTAGFVSFEYLRRRYGFDIGFDHYDDVTTDFDTVEEEQSRTTGPLLNSQIIPWLEENADRPFFLFAHYFDVHYHYDPPPPYDTMFDPGYAGPDLRHFTKNPAIHPGMPARHLEHLIALYDGEIRLTDRVVGEIIATIDRLRIGTETLVIVTADHGEEFFEHDGKGHGTTLYDEVVRVPLLVRWPAGLVPGRVVDTPVSLVDLAPTIYELMGVLPPAGLEGRSLAGLLSGAPDQEVPVYAHLHTRKRPTIWAMARLGHDKYLQDLHAPQAEFYDLEADPGERQNLFSPARSERLAQPLLGWLRLQWQRRRTLPPADRRIVVDRRNIEKLRALGYVD